METYKKFHCQFCTLFHGENMLESKTNTRPLGIHKKSFNDFGPQISNLEEVKKIHAFGLNTLYLTNTYGQKLD